MGTHVLLVRLHDPAVHQGLELRRGRRGEDGSEGGEGEQGAGVGKEGAQVNLPRGGKYKYNTNIY